MKKMIFIFSLFSALLVPSFIFAQNLRVQKRSWDVLDQFKIKSIRNLQASPKGGNLIFTVESDIWILPEKRRNPQQITNLKDTLTSPKWSPDGEKIAFFTSDESRTSLWVVNRDGSSLKKLTDLEKSNAYLGRRGNQLCWSPCGRYLSYTAAGPRHYSNIPKPTDPPNGNDVMVVERLLYKAFYYYSDMRRTHVFIISADGGKPKQISFGDYDYHSISWAPDGKSIACVSNRTGKDDYNANNDICLLSTEGKDMIQITHTIGPEYGPVYSPDGSKMAFPGRVRDHRSKESDDRINLMSF